MLFCDARSRERLGFLRFIVRVLSRYIAAICFGAQKDSECREQRQRDDVERDGAAEHSVWLYGNWGIRQQRHPGFERHCGLDIFRAVGCDRKQCGGQRGNGDGNRAGRHDHLRGVCRACGKSNIDGDQRHAGFDQRDAGQYQYQPGVFAAVPGGGNVQRWDDAEYRRSGGLGFVGHRGGDYQLSGAGGEHR